MLNLRQIYSTIISLIGIVLLFWGGSGLFAYHQLHIFFLLLILSIAAKSTATRIASDSISIDVSSAISFAAIALYDPFGAAFIAAMSEIGQAVINRNPNDNWKVAVERLGENAGINGIAIFIAGYAFVSLQSIWGVNATLLNISSWLLTAVIADQVNFWLLMIILYLVQGIKPLQVWRDNRWATPINVLVMAIGGSILSIAVQELQILGLVIFFLPILLSFYSFRIVANNHRKQMVQLEELVALRTQALTERTQELTSVNGQLENLHKEKDSFLAVLTHDMRTPLTSIKGYASLLQTRDLPRDQQVKIAKIISQSQETLSDIVNNILELEKLESGSEIVLEHTRFDLAKLVKNTAETITGHAMEKEIIIQYNPQPDPILIQADEKKISRVLMNLVSNAVKYTQNGGEVSVSAEANGRYAIVDIKDNGYGIPEDELPHIFDRFRRVQGHRSLAVGTGLGLAIVKSLVEAHGGDISVVSQEDIGSTFTLKIPYTPAPVKVPQLQAEDQLQVEES